MMQNREERRKLPEEKLKQTDQPILHVKANTGVRSQTLQRIGGGYTQKYSLIILRNIKLEKEITTLEEGMRANEKFVDMGTKCIL
eukprot:2760710-Ditylum_brightwellii.AAC.1